MKNYTQNAIKILFPDPFLKSQSSVYLWINILKFHTACFYVCQVEDYQNILKLSCRQLAFTSYKAFLKNKRSRTSLPISFSAWFLKKNISFGIFYYLAKFQCLVAFTLRDINLIITVSEGNTGEYWQRSKYCPSLRGQYLTEVNIWRYCRK